MCPMDENVDCRETVVEIALVAAFVILAALTSSWMYLHL